MKNSVIRTLTLAAASGLLVCSQVSAFSAFTDDFNSYTTGNVIVGEPGSDWLNGAGDTQTGGLQTLAAAEESPFTGIVGGKSGKLDDSSSTLGQGMGLIYSSNSGSDEVTIQFDYYFSNLVGFAPYVIANDGVGSGIFLALAKVDAGSGTGYSIASHNPGNTFTMLADVALSTWYRVTVIGSAVTDTYDVRLQEFGGSESVIGTNRPFRTGVPTLNRFSFIENNGNTATGIYTIDNVSIIPEPGTYAATFGLLGLGLVLGRRRIVRRS